MRIKFENDNGFYYDLDDDFLYCIGRQCDKCSFKEFPPYCHTMARIKAQDIANKKLNAIVDIILEDSLEEDQKIKEIYSILLE